MKNWKAECPKCQHIEVSEAQGAKCGNCNAPALMSYGTSKGGWQDYRARQSWRQMQCSRDCGWTVNRVKCSKCGTTIQGDFFKGDTKWCFVATASFNDEDHITVETLRNWRDNTLVHSSLGRFMIHNYYCHGEKLALKLNEHPVFKPLMRTLLSCFARIVK